MAPSSVLYSTPPYATKGQRLYGYAAKILKHDNVYLFVNKVNTHFQHKYIAKYNKLLHER